jgi:hypothetical protein
MDEIATTEAPVNRRRPWHAWLPVLASALLLIHFLGSAGFWSLSTYGLARNSYLTTDWAEFLAPAVPCALLLVLSGVCLVAALQRRRWAWPCIALTLCLSVAAFGYDVVNHRSQMCSVRFGQEGYQPWTRHYFTWWWFNEPCTGHGDKAERPTPVSQSGRTETDKP